MSYEFYKVLHILALAILVMGLAGMIQVRLAGSPGASLKGHFIYHGLGLILLLVSGFGMLAKLGILTTLPGWIIGKLVIWLLLGGIVVLIKRKPELSYLTRPLVILLVTFAAYLAIFKAI